MAATTARPSELAPLSIAELDAAATPPLLGLAEKLAVRGFTEGRVLAYFSWSHMAALSWAERTIREPISPAAALVVLLTTARGIARELATDSLDELYAPLTDAGILVPHGDLVYSRASLVPVGRALLLCDHTELAESAIAAPDDSTYHLLGSLPDQIGAWLDVGTGNGALALMRGRESVYGTDVDERALAAARLSAHISGRPADLFALADGCETEGRFDLVTFNTPLPPELGAQRIAYRRASDPALFERFWSQVGERLLPGGEVLAHTWIPADELPPGLSGGEITIARYTDEQDPAFGIVRWRPDQPEALDRRFRPLTRHRPHLRRPDIE